MSQNSSTKIAVYSQDKFRELGYLPISHPDGYIYFEKRDDNDINYVIRRDDNPINHDTVESCSTACAPHEEHSNTEDTISSNPSNLLSHNRSDQASQSSSKEVHLKEINCEVKVEELSDYDELEGDSGSTQQLRLEACETFELKWKSEIDEIGHAMCFFPTCNFISLSFSTMVQHFTRCQGDPIFYRNLCSLCGCWLISSAERDIHRSNCSGKKFGSGIFPRMAIPPREGATSVTDKIVRNCATKGVQRTQLKGSAITEECKDVIIQPKPKLPEGTYLRRRGYTSVHIESWLLKLAECNYISCHFKDCLFIAMSVEDMCMHFGFCTGDSSFAKFKCQYCGGVVTSQKILDLHAERSHKKEVMSNLFSTAPSSSNAFLPLNPSTTDEEEEPRLEKKQHFKAGGSCAIRTPSLPIKSNTKKHHSLEADSSIISQTDQEFYVGHEEEYPQEEQREESIILCEGDIRTINEHLCTTVQDGWKPNVHSGHEVPNEHADHLYYAAERDLSKPLATSNPPSLMLANVQFCSDISMEFEAVTPFISHHAKTEVAIVAQCDSMLESPQSVRKDSVTTDIAAITFLTHTEVKNDITKTKKQETHINEEPDKFNCPLFEKSEEMEKVGNLRKRKIFNSAINEDRSSFERTTVITDGRSLRQSFNDNMSSQCAVKTKVRRTEVGENSAIGVGDVMNSHHYSKIVDPVDNDSLSERFNAPVAEVNTGNDRLSVNQDIHDSNCLNIPVSCVESNKCILNVSDALGTAQGNNVVIVCNSDAPFKETCHSADLKSLEGLSEDKTRQDDIVEKPVAANNPCSGDYRQQSSRRGRKRALSVEISNKHLAELEPGAPESCVDKISSKEVILTPSAENEKSGLVRRPGRRNIKKTSEVCESEVSSTENKKSKAPKTQSKISDKPSGSDKCGKCGEAVGRRWENHNAMRHAGLGWMEGDEAFDLTAADSNDLLVKIRTAFRICKTATCEKCGVVKKSFIGFHSHILVCGKSEKEMEKTMAKCPTCGKLLKPCSLASHEKAIHSKPAVVETEMASGKRRSALRAIANLQVVIAGERKSTCVLYKKGDVVPELSNSMKPKYQKGKSYKCKRKDCKDTTLSVREAIDHFFTCPTMPEEYFQCLECPFFTLDEQDANNHLETHNKEIEKQEYEASTESDEFDAVDDDDREVRVRQSDGSDWGALSQEELKHKKAYAIREKLSMPGSKQFYSKAFEAEFAEQSKVEIGNNYPDFNTSLCDWECVEGSALEQYLPPLRQSLPVGYNTATCEVRMETCQVFHAFVSKGLAAGFVGGVVQNLAWCPVNLRRTKNAHQLLAVSVASQVDDYPSLRSTNAKTALLQIWDYGCLNYESENQDDPRMVVALALNYGELWDLTWSPRDTWHQGDNMYLPRMGIVATAFHDGAIRIFSISVPDNVGSSRLPVYVVSPVAILLPESESQLGEDPCLKVSWGGQDVICGGYRSGLVFIWRLVKHSISSKQGATLKLIAHRSFRAGGFPVTALALCPRNPRLLATNTADKCVRHWDLEAVPVPLRTETGTCFQSMRWMRHWPALFHLWEEDNVIMDLPPHLRLRNGVYHLKCASAIKDITFSDWLFLIGVATVGGDVVIRPTSDPLYISKNKISMVVSKAQLTDSRGKQVKNNQCSSYAELERSGYGVVITDYNASKLTSNRCPMTQQPDFACYSATIPEKVVFNPNFLAFSFLAIGYRSGIVRVLRLKYAQKEITDTIRR